MTEIVEGVGGAQRERIEALHRGGHYFWIDVSLGETSPDDLAAALSIPEHALNVLLHFAKDRSPAHKFYADGRHVVFAFSCYLESEELAGATQYRRQPIEVHVLVSGAYLLTVHQERVSLPTLLDANLPEGRSEQYVIYAILDAMVASDFDALYEVELTLDDLTVSSTDVRAGRGRVRMTTLRETSKRLSVMRRRVGAQRGLFERLAVELTRIDGIERDDERYFDRVGQQVNRLLDAIDAAADGMARTLTLRLNETTYWLTVVATIFLPLTVLTGFFGMNFGWMVGEIDTQFAFWLLGVGSLVAGVALIWLLVVRESPGQADRDAARASSRSD